MKLTSVTSWLTGQLKLPFKNDYPAHLDASPPHFHAHLRFLIRHNFLAGRQAKFTTRPEHVAPWAWSCISSRTSPEPPRPLQIIQESDIRHRDRSKKYICSYLWTGPDRASTRIGKKLLKIIKVTTFLRTFRNFRAMARQASPQNDQQRAKCSFLNGNSNWRSNYAVPDPSDRNHSDREIQS